MGTARTRSVWRAETVRRILTAIHERALALAAIVGVGSLSWHQPRHGLAVCRSFGFAGKEPAGRVPGHTADRAWARALHRNRGQPTVAGAGECTREAFALWRGSDGVRLRPVSPDPLSTSDLGRYARRLPGPDLVVIFDGLGARRRINARARPARLAPGKRW